MHTINAAPLPIGFQNINTFPIWLLSQLGFQLRKCLFASDAALHTGRLAAHVLNAVPLPVGFMSWHRASDAVPLHWSACRLQIHCDRVLGGHHCSFLREMERFFALCNAFRYLVDISSLRDMFEAVKYFHRIRLPTRSLTMTCPNCAHFVIMYPAGAFETKSCSCTLCKFLEGYPARPFFCMFKDLTKNSGRRLCIQACGGEF